MKVNGAELVCGKRLDEAVFCNWQLVVAVRFECLNDAEFDIDQDWHACELAVRLRSKCIDTSVGLNL